MAQMLKLLMGRGICKSTDSNSCRADVEAIPGDRWRRQLGRSSSRLRGDDLDRRIVNLDPERLLRQHRAQRRLQSQAQVRISTSHPIFDDPANS